MNKTVLVIAAHADDEVLACAGTIAKHVDNGDNVDVVFMTDGVSSRIKTNATDTINRKNASKDALNSLSVKNIHQFNFPDNKLDSVPLLDVVQSLESIINNVNPSIIYTHFAFDLNIDHRIVHNAVMTACRPQSGSTVKQILSFEVLSSTEWSSPAQNSFKPQYIVDISQYWQKKEEALLCYHEELRPFPHSRSLKCIEALATLRGATHGLDKAEAFFVERIIK